MYKIGAIFERDGITQKASHQYRVGRTGHITFLKEGRGMLFAYDTQRTLHTSKVVDIAEDDHGVFITTLNSVYRLDEIEEG